MDPERNLMGRVMLAMAAIAAGSCNSPTQAPRSLEEVWFASQPPGFVRSRPAVAGTRAIFGSADGAIIARDVATGMQIWRTPVFAAGQVAGAELVATAGSVIVLGQREVAAVDQATGTIRWRFVPPVDARGSGLPGLVEATHAAESGNTIYVAAWGASVSAVDVESGKARWSWTLPRLSSRYGYG